MKLRLLTAGVFVAGCNCLIQAQSPTALAMTLNIEDSPSHTVILSEMPKITFVDNQMIISTVSGNDVIYSLDKVESYYFSAMQSGIEDIVSEDKLPAFMIETDAVSVKNLMPGNRIVVYGVQGIAVAVGVAGNDGVATVDTSDLAAGMYIVNYGTRSTKIVKR